MINREPTDWLTVITGVLLIAILIASCVVGHHVVSLGVVR